ncbi:hypothetical protein AB0L06_28315 [Spirillospora sp. NPDC052269]
MNTQASRPPVSLIVPRVPVAIVQLVRHLQATSPQQPSPPPAA